MLQFNFQVESAKELTEQQALELIKLFKAKGWTPKTSDKSRQRKKDGQFIEIKPGPAARQQRKVLALWHELGYDMAKLHARVKKQFGVDRFEWLEDNKALLILITDLEHRLDTQSNKKK
ncbi:MAG: regulatory protein GemA [Desulfobulbus sp.]|nr:regulatory protein GemA [Desulfobulbus sp.]